MQQLMQQQHPETTIRFLTAGHVDDGKSTLIGRLLYELNVIPDDHIEAARTADGSIDFSLFTDGLEDERAQGITIDVAYRYFRYGSQRFRIADTPGHLQYMRNMAVAALDADIAVILADAVHGVRLQTVQYSKIARFFGVRRFVVAINKMDAVDYSKARYDDIVETYTHAFADDTTPCDVHFVPLSALVGDNIVTLSDRTPWYTGAPLLHHLTQAPTRAVAHGTRISVQHMVKDAQGKRWYLGQVQGKMLNVGEKLTVADTRQHVHIAALMHSGKNVAQAQGGQAIALQVQEDSDISRGSVLHTANTPTIATDSFYADVLWLDGQHSNVEHAQALIKLHHHEVQAQLSLTPSDAALTPAYVTLAHPVGMDRFADNPSTGLFILIDPYSERVMGVGTIRQPLTPDMGVAI